MSGPFELTAANIKIKANTPGVFCLGRLAPDGKLNVIYVGRSDSDVAARLRHYVGQYDAFVYSTAQSPLGAFVMECELYHDLRPPRNSAHPRRRTGTKWICPICDRLG
jgi:hypothetical protein